MSEPFLSEIRMFGFTFAPRGWAFCDGQLLPINQNQALFSLLGTIYGGDGRTTFALPDLRGRTPVHLTSGFPQGQRSGEERHVLQTSELPQHTHAAAATGDQGSDTNIAGETGSPNNVLASQARRGRPIYSGPVALTPMHPGTVTNTGGNQGHNNMQPYLTLSFAIAVQGVFPSRS